MAVPGYRQLSRQRQAAAGDWIDNRGYLKESSYSGCFSLAVRESRSLTGTEANPGSPWQ